MGRRLCFSGGHQAELHSRISSAWAAFHMHKGELCNKNYCIKARAKLFDAVVTPTVLYGCPAWVLTKTAEQQLKTLRRKMLRYVSGLRLVHPTCRHCREVASSIGSSSRAVALAISNRACSLRSLPDAIEPKVIGVNTLELSMLN